MSYQRYQVGFLDSTDLESLRLSITAELDKIQNKLIEGLQFGSDEISYKEPDNPQPLQVAFADGAKWNPGAGTGWYMYTPVIDTHGTILNLKWVKVGTGAAGGGDVKDVKTPGMYVRESGKWTILPVNEVPDNEVYLRTSGGWVLYHADTSQIVEYRFMAGNRYQGYTLDNPAAREPETNNIGWTTEYPNLDTAKGIDSIYVIKATIDRVNNLVGYWSTPMLYATPEGVVTKVAYAVGDADTYPPFNAQATDMPGTEWHTDVPNKPVGKYLWVSNRLTYTDGNKFTDWDKPTRMTGDQGIQGIRGTNGDVVENWFKETSQPPTAPTSYPPQGWSEKPPQSPNNPVWSVWIRVHADGTTEPSSYPIKVSGKDGATGPQGPDGNYFETWYLKVPIGTDVNTPVGYPAISTNGSTVYKWDRHPITLDIDNVADKVIKTQALIKYDGSGLADGAAWTFPVIEFANGRKGDQGIPGDSLYTWVRYADDIYGHGISDSPKDKSHVGYAYNKVTNQATDNRLDYKWFPLGASGSNGPQGQRGNMDTTMVGTVWSPENAWDEIVTITSELLPNHPIPWDKVTVQSSDGNFAQTYRFVSGKTRPGVWERVEKVIDGALIVNGTITGQQISANAITSDKIKAGTIEAEDIKANTITSNQIASKTINADNIAANTITSSELTSDSITTRELASNSVSAQNIIGGSITGDKVNAGTRIVIGDSNEVVVLDAKDSVNRFWVGNTDSQQATTRITKNGELYATGATISGNISAATGTFSGTVQGAHIVGGSIDGTSININKGNFLVNSDGSMSAKQAVIRGTVYATDGTFTGHILGGDLNIGGGNCIIANNGNLTAKHATLTGGKIGNVDIDGNGWLVVKTDEVGGLLIQEKLNSVQIAGIGNLMGNRQEVIWAGGTYVNAPFKVLKDGTLIAKQSQISGTITSSVINGATINGGIINSVEMNTSTLNSSTINTATLNGGIINGMELNIGQKFHVTPQGVMTATGATITGTVNANSGHFSNVVIDETCTINGTVKAEKIVGDLVSAKAFYAKQGSLTLQNSEIPLAVMPVRNNMKHNATVLIDYPPIDVLCKSTSGDTRSYDITLVMEVRRVWTSGGSQHVATIAKKTVNITGQVGPTGINKYHQATLGTVSDSLLPDNIQHSYTCYLTWSSTPTRDLSVTIRQDLPRIPGRIFVDGGAWS